MVDCRQNSSICNVNGNTGEICDNNDGECKCGQGLCNTLDICSRGTCKPIGTFEKPLCYYLTIPYENYMQY